ncbi:MAG: hypothetical protein HOY71_27245, partial [Nonomuraea sp.]|nr:hypothetical protein [Nonomuraea sp.]
MSFGVAAPPWPPAPALALVRAARPRQWLKNLLVLAAPMAAGVLGEPRDLLAALLVLGAF